MDFTLWWHYSLLVDSSILLDRFSLASKIACPCFYVLVGVGGGCGRSLVGQWDVVRIVLLRGYYRCSWLFFLYG